MSSSINGKNYRPQTFLQELNSLMISLSMKVRDNPEDEREIFDEVWSDTQKLMDSYSIRYDSPEWNPKHNTPKPVSVSNANPFYDYSSDRREYVVHLKLSDGTEDVHFFGCEECAELFIAHHLKWGCTEYRVEPSEY